MSQSTRLPRSVVLAGLAAFTIISGLAAIHLQRDERAEASLVDPRTPDPFAPDVTGEVKLERTTIGEPELATFAAMAEKQYGPLPPPFEERPLASSHPRIDGAAALAEVLRIRQIREARGTPAALAAIQAGHSAVPPNL